MSQENQEGEKRKYTEEEIDELGIPYAYKDSCVDFLVEYRFCVKTDKWSFLPFSGKYGSCKKLYDRWMKCQSNREFMITQEMKAKERHG
ncbi:unnamed protein product [Moneuplotes crassus]|uniref:Uncharacterized protein n=1 Tax=Euplotes crassus TaxID=5936 RepID=A0AAD1Y6F4_EUPCR|nr:unnamed protein product [Moneuplotes crassus]